jgi:hypothetical protein
MVADDSFYPACFQHLRQLLSVFATAIANNNRSRMGAATRAPLTAAGASWSVFCRVITTSGHNDKITLSGASLELHFSTKMSF